MPLIIPQTLPAYKALEEENVFVMHRARAMTQDIRPLRPQQRAHIRPAHRRDARGSAGRAAAGQIEQHRFGIVAAVVGRSHPQRADLFRRFA